MTEPIELIRQFCAEWEKGHADLDRILAAYFTDDVVYHNIPVEPVHGHDGIREVFALFAGAEKIEFRVRHIAAAGDVVLTERLDVFHMPNVTIELPVSGTFEVRDGKISAWRDYFDLNQYMSQLQ